ncbi:STAS domain-containing protein [Singulisphaera sp. GP187]|uniref:STAS domain-containing protein n=1 Tax=Singulisphaera sp. GP187 TaxID=1882752 RepID=UPI0020B15277|nr:STAS domain-containing protein [Singulisphaera sp. GP187]
MVNDVAVVEITSKDLRGPDLALELGAELSTVAGQEWAQRLLLNFRHVRFLSSTGFAVLAKLMNGANATGQQIKLCELDPDVRVGADIIGLSKYVEIHDHEAAALKAFTP